MWKQPLKQCMRVLEMDEEQEEEEEEKDALFLCFGT